MGTLHAGQEVATAGCSRLTLVRIVDGGRRRSWPNPHTTHLGDLSSRDAAEEPRSTLCADCVRFRWCAGGGDRPGGTVDAAHLAQRLRAFRSDHYTKFELPAAGDVQNLLWINTLTE